MAETRAILDNVGPNVVVSGPSLAEFGNFLSMGFPRTLHWVRPILGVWASSGSPSPRLDRPDRTHQVKQCSGASGLHCEVDFGASVWRPRHSVKAARPSGAAPSKRSTPGSSRWLGGRGFGWLQWTWLPWFLPARDGHLPGTQNRRAGRRVVCACERRRLPQALQSKQTFQDECVLCEPGGSSRSKPQRGPQEARKRPQTGLSAQTNPEKPPKEAPKSPRR